MPPPEAVALLPHPTPTPPRPDIPSPLFFLQAGPKLAWVPAAPVPLAQVKVRPERERDELVGDGDEGWELPGKGEI